MTRLSALLHIGSRLLVLLVGIGLLSFYAARPDAAGAKDGNGEVRVTGACGSGATSKLRLKNDDDGIQLWFEVEHSQAGVIWRVVLVHERRIAWRGAVRTSPDGSFEVRRTLRDFPGADAVNARGWGPRGLVCRATATLRGA